MRSFIWGFIFAGILSFHAHAQIRPVSDPKAVSLAAQSIAAISGSSVFTDVTLRGTATWDGRDSGTFQLMAIGNNESRLDLSLSSGARTEIRDAQTGAHRGQWAAPNNKSGKSATHNCWADAAWFFPALGSLARPDVVLTYVGQEARKGTTVHHLHSYIYRADDSEKLGAKQFSAMDFYLNASTLLPIATTFNTHPDKDATTNLLVEVEFSDYQSVNGVMVPNHIQRYQQGHRMLDLTITGATFNSGITLSQFSVN